MIRIIFLMVLSCLSPLAHAATGQIVPVTVNTPGGFGPASDYMPPGCVPYQDFPHAKLIRCNVEVPAGTTAIVGWASGWDFDLEMGIVDYLSIAFWHDGGTPHMLDDPHCFTRGCYFPPVFYPAGNGHTALPGDLVYAVFGCVGKVDKMGMPLLPKAWCAASATFHFRVGP